MIKKIFIVAGHGGGAPGAIAIDGTTERQIVVALAKKVEALFEQKHVTTIGVYEELTLENKIKRINAICKADRLTETDALLISLHCDSRIASEGAMGYYGSFLSQKYLVAIVNKLAKDTERKNKGIKSHTASRFGKLGIIADTIPTAMLLECGSLRADDNDADGLELLKSEAGQDRIAKSIAEGMSEVTGIQLKNNEISSWAEKSAKKAIEKDIVTDWSDPREIVADARVEWIFHKLGVFGEVTGQGITLERFVVALDRLKALD